MATPKNANGRKTLRFLAAGMAMSKPAIRTIKRRETIEKTFSKRLMVYSNLWLFDLAGCGMRPIMVFHNITEQRKNYNTALWPTRSAERGRMIRYK